MTNVVFSKKSKITQEYLMEKFQKESIDARVFFWPLSTLPFINKTVATPVSFDLPNRSINLPSYHDITVEELERVVKVILGF